MDDKKFYFLRIISQDTSLGWSETSPDDYDYDSDEFAIDGGTASMDGDYAETIANIIGSRGEYLDWVELQVGEVYCEEWAIMDEVCLEDIHQHYLGHDEIEVIIEESPYEWVKKGGEWFRVDG